MNFSFLFTLIYQSSMYYLSSFIREIFPNFPLMTRHTTKSYINKPDRTKPRLIRKPIKTNQQSPKLKPLCLSDLKSQLLPCQLCNKLLKGPTCLSRHLKNKHKCQAPDTITVNKQDQTNTHKKSSKGRPKKNIIQEIQTESDENHLLNAYFMADFQEVFYKLVKEKRKQDKIKGDIQVKDYGIYQDSLSPSDMYEVIQNAQNKFLNKNLPEHVKEFGLKLINLSKLFIQHLKNNPYPEYMDPMNPTPLQLKQLQNSVEENDLEEFIMFEAKNNFFETTCEQKWKYFKDNFNKEFGERIKKDVLILAWASGMVRNNLFEEYLCLALSVIQSQSRVDKFQKEGIKVDSEISQEKYQGQLREILEDDEQYELIGQNCRKKLIELRCNFLDGTKVMSERINK